MLVGFICKVAGGWVARELLNNFLILSAVYIIGEYSIYAQLNLFNECKFSKQTFYTKLLKLFIISVLMSFQIDFSLTVKAATLIFISGRSSAISSAKQG